VLRRTVSNPGQRRGFGRFLLVPSALAAILLTGFYLWQPWEIQFLPRALPAETRWTEPEPERLFLPGVRVVVVTAHPDDAEFYIGGLLSRLAKSRAEVHLVICTDGDKGYYPFEDVERNRAIRQREQRAAAAVWKAADVIFLGFPDGRLRESEALVRAIERELRRIRPAYLFCFDAEYPPRIAHQDHRRSGGAAEMAAKRADFRGWLCRFSTSAPNFAFDVSDVWRAKMELVAIHQSQFFGERLNRIRAMIERRDAEFGRLIGVVKAEGVRVSRYQPSTTSH
jgi:LmbE family N-acetylglucosaminyl deacetylase